MTTTLRLLKRLVLTVGIIVACLALLLCGLWLLGRLATWLESAVPHTVGLWIFAALFIVLVLGMAVLLIAGAWQTAGEWIAEREP